MSCGPATVFQAASISKPVAALATLILVDRGTLNLDDDVNDHLTSWRLPVPAAGPPGSRCGICSATAVH